MLSYWLYISTVNVPSLSAEEALIYRAAKERNRRLGVTGYLHRENGHFVQYIEGAAEALQGIKRLIRSDWRHTNLRELHTGTTLIRRFVGWDMVFTNEETNAFRNYQNSRGREPDVTRAPASEILEFMFQTVTSGKLEPT